MPIELLCSPQPGSEPVLGFILKSCNPSVGACSHNPVVRRMRLEDVCQLQVGLDNTANSLLSSKEDVFVLLFIDLFWGVHSGFSSGSEGSRKGSKLQCTCKGGQCGETGECVGAQTGCIRILGCLQPCSTGLASPDAYMHDHDYTHTHTRAHTRTHTCTHSQSLCSYPAVCQDKVSGILCSQSSGCN